MIIKFHLFTVGFFLKFLFCWCMNEKEVSNENLKTLIDSVINNFVDYRQRRFLKKFTNVKNAWKANKIEQISDASWRKSSHYPTKIYWLEIKKKNNSTRTYNTYHSCACIKQFQSSLSPAPNPGIGFSGSGILWKILVQIFHHTSASNINQKFIRCKVFILTDASGNWRWRHQAVLQTSS